MGGYDLLMLAILAGAILFGAWKGFAWQVASLAAIFLSYVVALKFRGPLAAQISAEHPWNQFAAMLIIYVVCALAIWLAFGYVRKVIDQLKLKDFDRQIGALLGAVKGVILCIVVTLFAVTLSGEERRAKICKSQSGYYISVAIDKLHGVVPNEVHNVLHPYVHEFQENVNKVHNEEGREEIDNRPPSLFEYSGTIERTEGKLLPSADNWATGSFTIQPSSSDNLRPLSDAIHRTAERIKDW